MSSQMGVPMRNGRSSSEVSIFNYPEHLNPFYEEDNHKRLRFWNFQKNGRAFGSRSSFSFENLRDLWTFKPFNFKKRSSTLGINKTSESPPTLRRSLLEKPVNGNRKGYDQDTSFRCSLQNIYADKSTLNTIDFNRNDQLRRTTQFAGNLTPLPTRSSGNSLETTNPFLSCNITDDKCSQRTQAHGKTIHRTKRKAPLPPNIIVDTSNNGKVIDNPNLYGEQNIDIQSLTNEINEYVNQKINFSTNPQEQQSLKSRKPSEPDLEASTELKPTDVEPANTAELDNSSNFKENVKFLIRIDQERFGENSGLPQKFKTSEKYHKPINTAKLDNSLNIKESVEFLISNEEEHSGENSGTSQKCKTSEIYEKVKFKEFKNKVTKPEDVKEKWENDEKCILYPNNDSAKSRTKSNIKIVTTSLYTQQEPSKKCINESGNKVNPTVFETGGTSSVPLVKVEERFIRTNNLHIEENLNLLPQRYIPTSECSGAGTCDKLQLYGFKESDTQTVSVKDKEENLRFIKQEQINNSLKFEPNSTLFTSGNVFLNTENDAYNSDWNTKNNLSFPDNINSTHETFNNSSGNVKSVKRKSVKDIIDSINRSQKLLCESAAKGTKVFLTPYISNQLPNKNELNTSNLKIRPTPHLNHFPHSSTDECQSKHDHFVKSKVNKNICQIRESSPTTFNLDWNPVPKPKRTSN